MKHKTVTGINSAIDIEESKHINASKDFEAKSMDALGTFAGWKQEFSSPDIQADIPSVNVSQVSQILT